MRCQFGKGTLNRYIKVSLFRSLVRMTDFANIQLRAVGFTIPSSYSKWATVYAVAHAYSPRLYYTKKGGILSMENILNCLACGAAITFAGVEDWRSSSISELSGLICWVTVYSRLVLNNAWILPIFIVLGLSVLYFSSIEITMFGDADLILVGVLTAFLAERYPNILLLGIVSFYSLSLLYPYACFYYRQVKHEKFRLFAGMGVPMFPIASIVYWLSAVTYVLLLHIFG